MVLMDLQMPEMDGHQATAKLRSDARFATIPIIAITSFAMYGDRGKVLDAGCTAYFEKPIDPLTIVARIHEAIGLKNE